MKREVASSRWRRAACRFFGQRALVPVTTCVHFGGFRYTANSFNPYRQYVVALLRGDDLSDVRHRFTNFLQHHRPRDIGEALCLDLTSRYPLWLFPWSRQNAVGAVSGGWHEEPADCPDLLTHFSEQGILRSRIEEEFDWMEKALSSVQNHGYNPRRFRSWIESRQLVHDDNRSAWLIEDGNHRLAVLSALNTTAVEVRYFPSRTVHRKAASKWPLVQSGVFNQSDAIQIFDAYFRDAPTPPRSTNPTPIVEGSTS